MSAHTILWRRLDRPGHEAARLAFEDGSWHLGGTAVFAHEGQACRLDYAVVCDPAWHTLSARVAGWVGAEQVEVDVEVDHARRWWVNGVESREVAGSLDVDLAISPSTNLLPIRRLALAVGQEEEVRAAWLRFPGFRLERLDQVYRRTGLTTYRYESAGGSFVAELEVNDVGLVTLYPKIWEAEAGG